MTQKPHSTPDGTRYPTDHVLGLLDSQNAGSAAKAALVAGGFAEDDVVLFNGVEDLQAIRSRETLLSRLGNALNRLDEDGTLGREVYMDALKAGQTLLMVYVPDDASVARARDILKEHGAQKMVALHRFSIEENL